MASTSYGVNDALAVKLWSTRMDVEALKDTTAYEFMGSGSGSLCQIMTETQKDSGDSVRFGLRMLLTGDGTTEGQGQEGNEEALTRYHDTLLINELGHAVRVNWKGTISLQRVPYDVRDEAYEGLKLWWQDRVNPVCALAA